MYLLFFDFYPSCITFIPWVLPTKCYYCIYEVIIILILIIITIFYCYSNECEDKAICGHECENNEGSYFCLCHDGYEVDGSDCDGMYSVCCAVILQLHYCVILLSFFSSFILSSNKLWLLFFLLNFILYFY